MGPSSKSSMVMEARSAEIWASSGERGRVVGGVGVGYEWELLVFVSRSRCSVLLFSMFLVMIPLRKVIPH